MHSWNRKLWRAALRLYEAYTRITRGSVDYTLPEESWSEVQRLLHRLNVAEARGWPTAAHRSRETLAIELERLAYRLRDLGAYERRSNSVALGG
jgi:IS1 family transposase